MKTMKPSERTPRTGAHALAQCEGRTVSPSLALFWTITGLVLLMALLGRAANAQVPALIDLQLDEVMGTLYAGDAGERTGVTMSAADLDGSGRDELILGVPFTRRGDGRVDIYFDPFISGATDFVSASNLTDATAPVRVQIVGESEDDWFGFAVATGDVNGDGRVDLAVSAVNDDQLKRDFAGSVYLYLGGNPALAGGGPWSVDDADMVFRGAGPLDGLGAEMAMGDFDGDGLDDLVMAAPFGDSEFKKKLIRRVYIMHGDTLATYFPLPTTPVEVDLLTDSDVIVTGVEYKELVNANSEGLLVVDYIDGDGIDDLVIGAPFGKDHSGYVYVLRGEDRAPGTYDIRDEAAIILRGEKSGEFGSSLASGDFDGNGLIDLAVCARYHKGENRSSGTATLLLSDVIVSPTATPLVFDLGEGRHSPFFEEFLISGDRSNDQFGSSAVAGDFNLDGIDDLAVGSPYGTREHNTSRVGRTYVFAGRSRAEWGAFFDTHERDEYLLVTGGRKKDDFGIAMTVGRFDDPLRPTLVVGATQADGYRNKLSKSGDIYLFGEAAYLPLNDHANLAAPPNKAAGPSVHYLWLWAQHWGEVSGKAPNRFDLNGDGRVDATDLRILHPRKRP